MIWIDESTQCLDEAEGSWVQGWADDHEHSEAQRQGWPGKQKRIRKGVIDIAAGQAYYVLHPQKDITICIFLTYQAFKSLEGVVFRQILLSSLSDLWLDTYEWKQTKMWILFKLKCGGVLISKYVVLFHFNHNLGIYFW